MSHMVIYRGSDGKPGYHQTDDIHDAVGFVEQMRNDQGVEHARIFRLEEVVFQYKPYYRVELAESGGAGELAVPGDGAANGTNGMASAESPSSSSGGFVPSPGKDEVTITTNGGGSALVNGGSGSSESPAAVGTGSTTSTSSTSDADDDNGSSKRGLFGR